MNPVFGLGHINREAIDIYSSRSRQRMFRLSSIRSTGNDRTKGCAVSTVCGARELEEQLSLSEEV